MEQTLQALHPKLALAVVFLVLVVSSVFAQNHDEDTQYNETVWTWKNPYREVKTAADLQIILEEHLYWIFSNHKKGSQANLSGADLSDANLLGANLSNAKLRWANLSNAKLRWAHLSGTDLSAANLSGVDFKWADLQGAHLSAANLSNANLSGANLSGAELFNATLSGADFRWANLSNVEFFVADLSSDNLVGARFENALISWANPNGSIFEPRSNPDIIFIAYAKNLEFVTYDRNPGPLHQLRKQFQDNGFREQERKITYALNRRRAQLDTPFERWFKTIAFDWTCQYGMSPGLALRLWLKLFLLCCVIYTVFIHLSEKSGLYRIEKTKKNESLEEPILPRQILSHPRWLYPLRFVARESRVIFWAVFFSLMSAFNIGFRDIDFGRWLRLLPRTEFDLKAKGWMRTVAGFQSLVSVYLIALWVLSYFGRPFE